mgnify:CR=1 FL=1
MKTPLVIGAESEMALNQKNNILSNEVVRRLSNVSEDRSSDERIKVIDDFTRELKSSGYNRPQAREIIVCGLLGLQRKRKRRKRDMDNAFDYVGFKDDKMDIYEILTSLAWQGRVRFSRFFRILI